MKRSGSIPLPKYTERHGWRGGDSHRLFTFIDRATGRKRVLPGNAGLRHSPMPAMGPGLDVRPATRAEALAMWQNPLHAGWKVVD